MRLSERNKALAGWVWTERDENRREFRDDEDIRRCMRGGSVGVFGRRQQKSDIVVGIVRVAYGERGCREMSCERGAVR